MHKGQITSFLRINFALVMFLSGSWTFFSIQHPRSETPLEMSRAWKFTQFTKKILKLG